jgi:hypothetical protein
VWQAVKNRRPASAGQDLHCPHGEVNWSAPGLRQPPEPFQLAGRRRLEGECQDTGPLQGNGDAECAGLWIERQHSRDPAPAGQTGADPPGTGPAVRCLYAQPFERPGVADDSHGLRRGREAAGGKLLPCGGVTERTDQLRKLFKEASKPNIDVASRPRKTGVH